MDEQIKILCVDDERNVLKSLRRLLMDEDQYDILLAESGAEGLEIMAEEGDVRLVISDYRMPEMNGVEFLREVTARWPDSVRIVLSGFADTAAVVEAINEGQIYKFIPKPWNDEELKTAISTALEHQALRTQNNRLNEELQEKNRQLQEINDKLEQLVAQRTEALEIRNRVLQISQGILDVLPVVVFGIDPDEMIVSCNEYAQDLFPAGGMGPLGTDRRSVFSPAVNELIDRLETERLPKAVLEIHGKHYRGEVRRLHETLSRGVVLALVPAG
ncbi:MAG: response regulator [Desulfuromonadales bacterium]|nr:response regulator [Desulfuromonadales bacterium]